MKEHNEQERENKFQGDIDPLLNGPWITYLTFTNTFEGSRRCTAPLKVLQNLSKYLSDLSEINKERTPQKKQDSQEFLKEFLHLGPST